MKALLINAATQEVAWDLLGDDASQYDDNGGYSDGPSLLPCDPSSMETERVHACVAAGAGRLVDVEFASDEAVYGAPLDESFFRDDEREATALLAGAADEKYAEWAHFGAYGTMNSTWVVVPTS